MNTSLGLARPADTGEAPCTTTALLAEGLHWLYDIVQPGTAIVPARGAATVIAAANRIIRWVPLGWGWTANVVLEVAHIDWGLGMGVTAEPHAQGASHQPRRRTTPHRRRHRRYRMHDKMSERSRRVLPSPRHTPRCAPQRDVTCRAARPITAGSVTAHRPAAVTTADGCPKGNAPSPGPATTTLPVSVTACAPTESRWLNND